MGRVYVLVSVLAMVWFVAGCAIPVTAVDFRLLEEFDFPEEGWSKRLPWGNRSFSEGRLTIPAIVVDKHVTFGSAQVESSERACGVTVPAGTYQKVGVREDEQMNAECYGPVQEAYHSRLDGTTDLLFGCTGSHTSGFICVDSQDTFMYTVGQEHVEPVVLAQQLDRIKIIDVGFPGLRNRVLELVYNGREGDSISVLYNEFHDDRTKPAFSQEVKYDLTESSVIGFKSVRLEVKSATESEIVYKMLSGFEPCCLS